MPVAKKASENEAGTIDLSRLREPFGPSDIEWRVQRAGKNDSGVWARAVAYVTARAIEDRLDEVCGPERWCDKYEPGPDGGVLCGIGIRVGGDWVFKWDGAENTDIEAIKGGLSGAFKRAAVKWGIGRYLYRLPEGWANVHENGRHYGKTKDGTRFRWDPPDLPAWATPGGDVEREEEANDLRERITAALDAIEPPAFDENESGINKAARLAEDPDAPLAKLRNAAEWLEGLVQKQERAA